MTWLEAIFAHNLVGHDEFIKLAHKHDKWSEFVKNVCNHLNCPQQDDPYEREETHA